MTTISDVAKKANVSKMTVSRVINHPEQVTDELKQLVFKSMADLNYRPNPAARALVNNRSHVIKLFILEKMDTVEPYYMNLLTGIAHKLEEHHYSLQLVTKNGFDIGSCDGYVITGMREDDFKWISGITQPVVLFGENTHSYTFVDTNNYLGTTLSTEHAVERGYDHIIYIGIDLDESFEISRENGYLDTMRKYNRNSQLYRFENRSRYAAAFIKENWHKFSKNTCFICSSDRLATGILREIISHQGKVPEDFGVIGFDGVFLDQTSSPQLTTVKQSIIEIGKACAEILIKKINNNGINIENQIFEPELIIRESSR